LLRWQLGSHYHLEEEVPVGQKPLQIDILLLHKEQGELPASARRLLAGFVEFLGEYTLVEFKSPSDTLRAGDFQTFLAYALLYRAQNLPLLEPGRLHLVVIAPRLTRPYREELRALGVTPEPQAPGIWRLQGGVVVHPTWVLETEALAGLDHPLLTLVSPRILQDHLATYDMLRRGGYNEMMVYMAQQIHQFQRLGKEFAMQHLGADSELAKVLRDCWLSLSPEERAEGMARMPIEERLAGIPPEDRLRGLTPEEREKLRQMLQPPSPGESDSLGQK
jgi:hypothetical protein